MKFSRSQVPEIVEALAPLHHSGKRRRRPRSRTPATLDGPAPCPRCGQEIVARMGRTGPLLWCRCVDRLPRPAA